MPSYNLIYYQMKATELNEENKQLRQQVIRLEERINQLQAHIELQRAEIIVLQNRNEQSRKLRKVFDTPGKRTVKSFEIDDRNTNAS